MRDLLNGLVFLGIIVGSFAWMVMIYDLTYHPGMMDGRGRRLRLLLFSAAYAGVMLPLLAYLALAG